MKLRVYCPDCETRGDVAGPAGAWHCPGCDHILTLPPVTDGDLAVCAGCGTPDLYRKKDFPHALGMGILIAALLASTVTYWFYDWWLTWAILIGSAAFDGILYLCVKDVIVCYRCHAEHRGVARPDRVPPFELTVHERYRQERLRREELQSKR